MKKAIIYFMCLFLLMNYHASQAVAPLIAYAFAVKNATTDKDFEVLAAIYTVLPEDQKKKVAEKFQSDFHKPIDKYIKAAVGQPSPAIAADIEALKKLDGAPKARKALEVYTKILETAKDIERQIDGLSGKQGEAKTERNKALQ